MESRANFALVGAFTLAVVAALLGFVYWFSAGRNAGQKVSYRMVFTGSVSGLNRGSLVRFNGLPVGEVISLQIDPNDPSKVSAVISIDAKTPVKADTQSRLEYQGLTGQASVQLSGGTANAPNLTAPDGGRPVLFADRSDFQDVLETVQRISARADSILSKFDKVVSDNEGALTSTIRSIETFAKALADNSAGVGAFLASVGETSQKISSLSSRLESLSTTAEEVLKNVDGTSVRRVLTNVEAFTQGLADNRRNIDTIFTDGALLTKRLAETSAKLDGALTEIQRLASAVDSTKIGNTVDNLDKFTSVFGRNAADTERALKDISAITSTLRESSKKVDDVLTAASNFLGANQQEGQGAFTDIGAAARSFRELSDTLKDRSGDFSEMAKSVDRLAKNLDRRTAEITTGLNRLTNSSSRDIEALAADTRRAVNEVNRAVRNLGRDPSQIITGGRPALPEYSGSR
jgi:phospholipid/cholesterol/gamma-HCH transport system substrate-binding protein